MVWRSLIRKAVTTLEQRIQMRQRGDIGLQGVFCRKDTFSE